MSGLTLQFYKFFFHGAMFETTGEKNLITMPYGAPSRKWFPFTCLTHSPPTDDPFDKLDALA